MVRVANYSVKVFDPKIDTIYAAAVNGLTVKDLAVREHADVAINFSYADTNKGVPIGRLIVDGKTVIYDIDKTTNRDELYMLPDKSLHIGKHPNPVWAIQGTPPLLKNGKVVIDEGVKRDRTLPDVANRPATRTASGITAAGKLVLVRTTDAVTLEELAAIMLSHGCVDALNGDGGGSSYMYPIDNGWGRKLGAALIVKEGVKPVEKFVVDAGHGLETPGKRCPDDSMREFHFNSVTARYVRDGLLQYEDVEVKFSHDDSGLRDVPLSERVKVANDWGADAFISIHANAASSVWSSAHGIETFTCDEPSATSLKMAYAVQKRLIAITGLTDRGVKQEDFYVIAKTTMPAILVENGFMSNQAEAALLKTDAYRRKCAAAIVEGIAEVFELKKKVEVKPLSDTKITPVNVVIDGKKIDDGHIINGVTYAPVRALAEEFGAKIAWNQTTKTVTVTK